MNTNNKKSKISSMNENVPKKLRFMKILLQHVFKNEFEIQDNVSYWNGFYIFAILIYSVLFSSITLVIPQHDTIKHPQYWYELMYMHSLWFPANRLLHFYQSCSFVFKMPSMITLGATFRLFLATTLGFIAPYVMSYIIWTLILDYNHPMPFNVICGYLSSISFDIMAWFEFPINLRKDKIFRKGLKAYMLLNIWDIFEHLVYAGLAILFVCIPSHLQWILAIIMPILRYLNARVRKKLLNFYASNENKMAILQVDARISINYSTFVAINLAPATEITLFSVLTVEFILNLFLTWKICRLHRKIDPDDQGQDLLKKDIRNNIHSLVLNETIEVVVPLAYFITFFIAYYGPNATILGNVRNSYWDYKEVKDVGKLFKAGMEMFSIDTTSSIICGIVLYKFCKMNLFQEYCKLIKQCWAMIAAYLGSLIYLVKNYVL